MDSIISVDGLGKKYRILHQKERQSYSSLRDTATKRLQTFFNRRTKEMLPPYEEDFWALQDVFFEVKQGEVLGVIGRNGAGKSTLLKILSRITEPSEGRVTLRGRVASLLEVGTGFHPELTGRENIYLNGTILGMSRDEIRKKFAEIVEFAEVSRFLDTPVKRYSSGMYVRLAFAVAAHLEPEILIVDEVLAVGDAEFQKKCLGKMQDVAKGGRTVLFVSHNMAAISTLCHRAIVLQKGHLIKDGTPSECIQDYNSNKHDSHHWLCSDSENHAPLIFKELSLQLEGEQPNLNLLLTCTVSGTQEHPPALIAFDISSPLGSPLMQALPSPTPFITQNLARRPLKFRIALPPLVPGQYSISFWLGSHNTSTWDQVRDCITFEVHDSPTQGRTFPHHFNNGFIVPPTTTLI